MVSVLLIVNNSKSFQMMERLVNVKMTTLEQMEFVNLDVPLPMKFGMERFAFVLLISPDTTTFVDNVQPEALQVLIKQHASVQMLTQFSILPNSLVKSVQLILYQTPIEISVFVVLDSLLEQMVFVSGIVKIHLS